MRLLLSGAHLTPALAMIDFIKANHPEHELFFVGRLYSQEKLGQKAVEQLEVSKRQVKFIPFAAPKFVNYSFLAKLNSLLTFPKVLRQAREILLREKIDLFLSFGSYLAVPFALAAKSLQIPIITHEQTVVMGKANKFIATLADKVAISHPQTKKYLGKTDAVLTGNPVRARLFAKDLRRPTWIDKDAKNIILVMGGNQGSFVINDVLQKALPELLVNYTVIHQCGRANKLKNPLEHLSKFKQTLPKKLQDNYFIKEWIEDEDLFWIYQHSKFAISRAGANAILELSLTPLPAILIPLPNTYQDEQMANAVAMQKVNGALILQQNFLSGETLLDSVHHMEDNYKEMRLDLARNTNYLDASAKLYQLMVEVHKLRQRS